jgi:hypothetical protein
MTQKEVDDQKLEAALRVALEKEHPPLGFAQRVEARLAAEGRRQQRPRWRVIASRVEGRLATAAALVLAIIIPLGLHLHHESEVARGEAAKQQVMLALHITGRQLRTIEDRTHGIHAGSMPGGDLQ